MLSPVFRTTGDWRRPATRDQHAVKEFEATVGAAERGIHTRDRVDYLITSFGFIPVLSHIVSTVSKTPRPKRLNPVEHKAGEEQIGDGDTVESDGEHNFEALIIEDARHEWDPY